MWKRATTILLLISAALTATMLLGGCYYMQAVNGQLELMRKREPIPEVLANSTLPDDVRDKLELVMEARQFSVEALGLPDNGSYRSYADLERDFVVWNVFAAPEFSLEPKTWCFPVVGCVAYRGYFSEDDARRLAEELTDSGYDVYVGGVPAYSTLGRFDDPVLNTMMRWSDVDLISTVFHELAHQRLFVKGDTAFNESFATAVAEAGLERWLAERDESDTLERYYQRDQFRSELRVLADAAREDLAALYDSGVDEHAMRRHKEQRLAKLVTDAGEKARALGYADAGWLSRPANNARLASVSLYRGYLPQFRALLAGCDAELDCFYAEAERLAALDAVDREAELTGDAKVHSE
jgi:predicted aminopeptidase